MIVETWTFREAIAMLPPGAANKRGRDKETLRRRVAGAACHRASGGEPDAWASGSLRRPHVRPLGRTSSRRLPADGWRGWGIRVLGKR